MTEHPLNMNNANFNAMTPEEQLSHLVRSHAETQQSLQQLQQQTANAQRLANAAQERLAQRDAEVNQLVEALREATRMTQAAATIANQAREATRPATVKCNKPANFDGAREVKKVRNFTHSVRTYLNAMATNAPAVEQVNLIASFLRDDALSWWISRVSKYTPEQRASWTAEIVLTEIEREFIPRMAKNEARSKLKSIKMGQDRYQEYYDAFTNLLISAGDASDSEKVDWFIQGLTNQYVANLPATTRVSLDQLTYEQLIAACETLASYSKAKAPHSSSSSQREPKPQPNNANGEPMDLGHTKVSAAKQPKRFPRLSTEEKDKLRQENKCFICRQAGHMSRQCPEHSNNKKKADFRRQ